MLQMLVSADGIEGWDEIKKRRDQAQREFENSNIPYTPSRTPDEFVLPKKRKKFSFEGSTVDPRPSHSPATIQPSPEASNPLLKSSYLRRVKNAYACFRIYVSNLYQARFKRDVSIEQCVQGASTQCENQVAEKLTKNVTTFESEFHECLDRP